MSEEKKIAPAGDFFSRSCRDVLCVIMRYLTCPELYRMFRVSKYSAYHASLVFPLVQEELQQEVTELYAKKECARAKQLIGPGIYKMLSHMHYNCSAGGNDGRCDLFDLSSVLRCGRGLRSMDIFDSTYHPFSRLTGHFEQVIQTCSAITKLSVLTDVVDMHEIIGLVGKYAKNLREFEFSAPDFTSSGNVAAATMAAAGEYNLFKLNRIFGRLADQLNRLESIHVVFTELPEYVFSPFETYICNRFPHLKDLGIKLYHRHTYIREQISKESLCRWVRQFPLLEKITLSHLFNFDDDCVKAVVDACPRLHTICFRHMPKITPVSLRHLGKARQQWRAIDLIGSAVLQHDCIAFLLQRCRMLTRLELESSWMIEIDSGIKHEYKTNRVHYFKHACSLLTYIDVSHCNFTDLMIEILVSNTPLLEHFDMKNNSRANSDKAVYAVANKCPNLLHLNVSNNYKLTNAGIEAVLMRCQKIQDLGIASCNKLTSELVTAINQLGKSLRRVSMYRLFVDGPGALRSIRPDIYVDLSYSY